MGERCARRIVRWTRRLGGPARRRIVPWTRRLGDPARSPHRPLNATSAIGAALKRISAQWTITVPYRSPEPGAAIERAVNVCCRAQDPAEAFFHGDGRAWIAHGARAECEGDPRVGRRASSERNVARVVDARGLLSPGTKGGQSAPRPRPCPCCCEIGLPRAVHSRALRALDAIYTFEVYLSRARECATCFCLYTPSLGWRKTAHRPAAGSEHPGSGSSVLSGFRHLRLHRPAPRITEERPQATGSRSVPRAKQGKLERGIFAGRGPDARSREPAWSTIILPSPNESWRLRQGGDGVSGRTRDPRCPDEVRENYERFRSFYARHKEIAGSPDSETLGHTRQTPRNHALESFRCQPEARTSRLRRPAHLAAGLTLLAVLFAASGIASAKDVIRVGVMLPVPAKINTRGVKTILVARFIAPEHPSVDVGREFVRYTRHVLAKGTSFKILDVTLRRFPSSRSRTCSRTRSSGNTSLKNSAPI